MSARNGPGGRSISGFRMMSLKSMAKMDTIGCFTTPKAGMDWVLDTKRRSKLCWKLGKPHPLRLKHNTCGMAAERGLVAYESSASVYHLCSRVARRRLSIQPVVVDPRSRMHIYFIFIHEDIAYRAGRASFLAGMMPRLGTIFVPTNKQASSSFQIFMYWNQRRHIFFSLFVQQPQWTRKGDEKSVGSDCRRGPDRDRRRNHPVKSRHLGLVLHWQAM